MRPSFRSLLVATRRRVIQEGQSIAELGDPSRFRDAAALAGYVGVVPRLRQSGKRAFSGARVFRSEMRGCAIGSGCRPWSPSGETLGCARYERLVATGKRPKVALVACMRKLLGAIYSVARNRRPFVPHLAAAGHEQPLTAG